MSALRAAGSLWVWARAQRFGVVEVHAGVAGQRQCGVRVVSCLLGLAGGDQQPPDAGVEEGAVGVQPDRTQGIDAAGDGRNVSQERGRVDVGGAKCGKPGDGGLPGGPAQPLKVEAVPLGQLAQVGGQYRGAVQLTGVHAHPDLHCARIGEAERALGEPELVGPACRVRRLRLGAREIAAHQAGQGQVDVRHRERVGG
jgi:hypothetical protein